MTNPFANAICTEARDTAFVDGNVACENNIWSPLDAPEGYHQWMCSMDGDPKKVGWNWISGFGVETDFNNAIDIWLITKPDGGEESIMAEVMVWLHPPKLNFTPAGSLVVDVVPYVTAGNQVLELWMEPDGSHGPIFTFCCKNPTYAEIIDLRAILGYLVTRGSISDVYPRNCYITSVEFGNEVKAEKVFAYPEVKTGRKPWDSANYSDKLPIKLTDLKTLVLDLAFRNVIAPPKTTGTIIERFAVTVE